MARKVEKTEETFNEVPEVKVPTHGVNDLLVKVISNHVARGFDIDRIAAITMLSKDKVKEVIESL